MGVWSWVTDCDNNICKDPHNQPLLHVGWDLVVIVRIDLQGETQDDCSPWCLRIMLNDADSACQVSFYMTRDPATKSLRHLGFSTFLVTPTFHQLCMAVGLPYKSCMKYHTFLLWNFVLLWIPMKFHTVVGWASLHILYEISYLFTMSSNRYQFLSVTNHSAIPLRDRMAFAWIVLL